MTRYIDDVTLWSARAASNQRATAAADARLAASCSPEVLAAAGRAAARAGEATSSNDPSWLHGYDDELRVMEAEKLNAAFKRASSLCEQLASVTEVA